ncbi:PilY2 family type 4a fimbrial biogenesis protein [Stutzerimonas stutzeri]|uniref:PilY2 family type 4a fimbrial biogenesis protein n=1 Tax=Stutzerimonas sp. S1 TaxID=3030652 RepID=UPI002225B4BE|nr:PilY2 family type 4a fimbrial biogenesis protein [Stutzerimonas sp. S1]
MNYNKFFRPLIALSAGLLAGTAHSASFEGVGSIDDVQLGRNLIVVQEVIYALPNNTMLNGTPAILQLKPGYLIGFSGIEASPHSIIESIYLYPETVRAVEQGERP